MSEVASIGYYTAAEVGRLAGVSARRIGQWAGHGIIKPSVSRRPNVYSYADAGEAVVARYLIDEGFAPREVRHIVHSLKAEYGQWPLASAPLKHDGRLAVIEREDGVYDVVRESQSVMPRTLLDLKEIRRALNHGGWMAYKHRHEHIEVDPDLHSGDPVIRGRRITTSRVAALAAMPEGRKTLRDDFNLTDEEIDDAVGYESELAAIAA